MKRKVLGKVEPRCEYCKHGKLSSDNEKILCPKLGVLTKDFSCKKFSYDPLKRMPERLPVLPQFSEDDFKL